MMQKLCKNSLVSVEVYVQLSIPKVVARACFRVSIRNPDVRKAGINLALHTLQRDRDFLHLPQMPAYETTRLCCRAEGGDETLIDVGRIAAQQRAEILWCMRSTIGQAV